VSCVSAQRAEICSAPPARRPQRLKPADEGVSSRLRAPHLPGAADCPLSQFGARNMEAHLGYGARAIRQPALAPEIRGRDTRIQKRVSHDARQRQPGAPAHLGGAGRPFASLLPGGPIPI